MDKENFEDFYLNENLRNEIDDFLKEYSLVSFINNEIKRNRISKIKTQKYLDKPLYYGKWFPIQSINQLKQDCIIEVQTAIDNTTINSNI